MRTVMLGCWEHKVLSTGTKEGDDMIDSFMLAMHAEGIAPHTISVIVGTVLDAIDNNEG